MARFGVCDRVKGRLLVANFAYHDDIRVLTQQRAYTIGEGEINARLNLHLV